MSRSAPLGTTGPHGVACMCLHVATSPPSWNDYGRFGQVLDLGSGRLTMTLDGGDYHPETVPFSLAFAELLGKTVLIHRTSWNRLDISDPGTGELLTERGPTSYESGQERPAHYLDFFHGGLHVSPGSKRLLDDGWIWHPVGVLAAWSIEPWLLENRWESEDGATKLDIAARDDWDCAATWLDDHRLAIYGIGEESDKMIPGARISTFRRRVHPVPIGTTMGVGRVSSSLFQDPPASS